MIRPAVRLAEWLGALLLALALGIGALVWRVAQGPLELDFLAPRIERTLSGMSGQAVRIGGLSVGWEGTDRLIDLQLTEVRLLGADGRAIARVPRVALRLSFAALTRGMIAPESIRLDQPSLRLTRLDDGEISFGFGAATLEEVPDSPAEPAPEDQRNDLVGTIVKSLLAPPDPGQPTGYLKSLELAGAVLVIDDRATDHRVRARAVNVRAQRSTAGAEARMGLALDLDRTTARLELAVTHDRKLGATDARLSFFDLRPAMLAAAIPELAPLAVAAMPISGTVNLSLDRELAPRVARLELVTGAGALLLPALYPDPVEVRYATLRGTVDIAARTLDLDQAVLALDRPVVSLKGYAAWRGDSVTVEGTATARDMPTNDLARHWPERIAVDARTWIVENLTDGRVPEARAHFVAALPESWLREGKGRPELLSLHGTLGYEGLTAHYFRPLPPVVDIVGTARFNQMNFDLDVTDGRLKDTVVERGTINITGLDVKDQDIDIVVEARGPVRDALEVIDHPRLGYAGRLGLNPADFDGRHAAKLRFTFPLEKKLTLDDVVVDVQSRTERLSQKRSYLNLAVSEGDLAIGVDSRGMSIAGQAQFNKVPAKLEWTESFVELAKQRRRVKVTADTDEAQRRQLGFDGAPFVRERTHVDLEYVEAANGRGQADVRINLGAARLELAELAWSKAPGIAAQARVQLDMGRGAPGEAARFTVTGPDLALEGRASLVDGAVRRVTLSRGRVGRSEATGNVQIDGAAILAQLRGPLLDARQMLKAEDDAESPSRRPFKLDGRFDRVLVAEGQEIAGVIAQLDHDGRRWRRVVIDARVGNTGRMAVRMAPRNAQSQSLEITSEDAGALLARFAGFESMTGGRLRLAGTMSDLEPGKPIAARLEIANFHIADAPILARILTFASLTGIVDLLTGDGIAFDRLSATLKQTARMIEISELSAVGSSLGVTLRGRVDRKSETVELQGTLAPAYTLSKVLGYIPLLGNILTNRGEGLFAAQFSLSGPLQDPTISVNPLSALAPGALRNIFNLFSGPPAGDPSTNRFLREQDSN